MKYWDIMWWGPSSPRELRPAADRDKMIKDIVASPENYLHNEKENLRKNGEKVWMIWTYKPILDEANNLKEILCIGIDRTQQKKAEELAAQQIKEKTAMEERTRLARDLHDAVSQTLFSTSLIAEVLPKVWERNKEEGLKKLEEVRQLTRGALAEMRTLLFELRPAALADADLNDLLRQLAESVIGRARVPVTLEVDGDLRSPSRCENRPLPDCPGSPEQHRQTFGGQPGAGNSPLPAAPDYPAYHR